jgi:transcriptional regulator with XRE-family HTH domain
MIVTESSTTVVQDVWSSLGSPTSAGSCPPGSSVRSPDVGLPSRTGESFTRRIPLVRSRPVTLIVHHTDGEAISISLLAELLQQLARADLRSLAAAVLKVPQARISATYHGGLIVETIPGLSTIQDNPEPTAPAESLHNDRNLASRLEPRAEHAKIAKELRLLTRLPTSSLASSLGVTREQYQRWLRGRPISTVRHGQLQYLHTIAHDVARRLGTARAHVWWRTPFDGDLTPQALLQNRELSTIHHLVALLPDPQPVDRDTLLGLRVKASEPDQAPEGIEGEEDWSPYSQSDGGRVE